MLKKSKEIIVPPGDPFVNDKLKRKNVAVTLTRILYESKQPFTISIEAPWGWGKTTFIKMWEAYLKEENFKCFYFNAWETDYSEDPLIPFIGRLSSYIEKINPDPEAKNLLKK